MTRTFEVHLPTPHPKQDEFIHCGAPRVICRAGRRSGKTVGVSMLAVECFLAGKRVLYGAPTSEQVDRFWVTVSAALAGPIAGKVFRKNETEHVIELRGTEQRLRAKTCWDQNTLRGDYADLLILDEYQLMNEDAWELVGAPMLLDHDGSAYFIYTPPSLRTTGRSKARDPRHAAKMFKRAEYDDTGRWRAFHFTSHDNPHISTAALADITGDMSRMAYEQEILAEDRDENPAALWKRADIDNNRVTAFPELERVIVGVDPTATQAGDEAGIIVAGKAGDHFYVLDDASLHASPQGWASAVMAAYSRSRADRIVAEANQGGEMVMATIQTVDPNAPVQLIHASRGKASRAEPVVAMYEQGRVHHVGEFPTLETEMLMWGPGDASPNRLDAMVYSVSELMSGGGGWGY